MITFEANITETQCLGSFYSQLRAKYLGAGIFNGWGRISVRKDLGKQSL